MVLTIMYLNTILNTPWFVVIIQSACQLWDTGTLLKPVEFWLLMIQNQAPNLVFNTLQQLYGPKNSFVH